MKPTHIIALASRLFAVALLLIAVRYLAAAIWVLDDTIATQKLIPLYAACAASLAAAALLWLFPLTLANQIYPIKSEKIETTSLDVDELYQLGFIVLGIYILGS
ncbi:MAG: hypothetical protein U1E13_04100 [Methylophilaceae bacterium]|nr:hypothetical protein [Methylophilaceae bacterium]